MDKKGFLIIFKINEEDKILKLWETIELCENIDYPIEGEEFYPPNIWKTIEKININKMKFKFKGLTEESEKKAVIVYPRNFIGEMIDFNLIYFKIDGTNKFKELYHKDFLGSIMSLGIKREVIGDLIVENNIAFGVIHDNKYNLIENIDKIGNTTVKISKISENEVPRIKFEDLSGTVSSLRIDNLVGEIGNISRQKAVDLIEAGLVMLNYNIIKEKSCEVKEDDIITIKKIGKFIISKNLGENKKGKIKINYKKFI